MPNPPAEPKEAPEGWRLVPIEPTDAMLGAGLRHVDGMASMPSAYRAMLVAAPQPPARKPLSIDQLQELWGEQSAYHGGEPMLWSHYEFARAIERAHGITE